MPIKSGRYIITNVQQHNLVTLSDPNTNGSPLVASVRNENVYEQWLVELHSNKTYSIRNAVHGDIFANVGDRAKLGTMVEGRMDTKQYWLIEETYNAGQYTICPTDIRLFWALEVKEVGTPINLLQSATDKRCWWIFEDTEPDSPTKEDEIPTIKMPKWAVNVLRIVFGFRSQRERSPKVAISMPITMAPFSSSRLGTDVSNLGPVITEPLSSRQQDRNVTILEPVISNSLSNRYPIPGITILEAVTSSPFSTIQPTPGATIREAVIPNTRSSGQTMSDPAMVHLDISFISSESRGLLDPLTSIVEALEKVLSAAKIIFKSDEEWKTPVRRLRFYLDTIKYQRLELEKDSTMDGTIPMAETKVIKPLEKYANHLRNIYRLVCDKKLVHASISESGSQGARNEETIGEMINHMELAFEEYTDALHSFADQEYKKMQALPQGGQNLGVEVVVPHYAQSKRLNTYGVQHKECLPGTRTKTLNAIREWANETSSAKPTFLLLDVAGSGKSTVAKTMAEELGRNRLVARYFFSRDTTATRSTDSFCSTVSDAFIRLAPDLEASVKAFKRRFDVKVLSFKELYNGLVADPLEKLSLDAILIIDALDECDDEDGSCTDLLNAICSLRPSAPRLRILATGRPELHITNWAKQYSIEWYNFLRLEGSSKDVDLYIEQMLQNLPDIHGTVIDLANGVFIWARIACDLIRKTADVNRLLKELGSAVSLDYLYKVALNQSVPKDEGSRRVFAVVLQMILSSRSPLSIAELEKLAPEPRIVEQIITRLGALLVYQSREDPIRLLHATFREFLTDPSKADRYLIQLGPGHHTLTLGCINYITQHQASQKAFTLGRPDDISKRVYVYSSESWVHHCMASYRKLAMDPQILEFSNTCLQTWAYSTDDWSGIDTISCLRDVILLSHQGMLPQITETAIDKSLETASSDHYPL